MSTLLFWTMMLVIAVSFTLRWREASTKLDRELPCVLKHVGPQAEYADYRICLGCGTRQDQPYDVEKDGAL